MKNKRHIPVAKQKPDGDYYSAEEIAKRVVEKNIPPNKLIKHLGLEYNANYEMRRLVIVLLIWNPTYGKELSEKLFEIFSKPEHFLDGLKEAPENVKFWFLQFLALKTKRY